MGYPRNLGILATSLGIDPTGGADCLAAVNTAITNMVGTGNVLYFGTGTYLFSAAITNPSGVGIMIGKGAIFTGAGALSITSVATAWPDRSFVPINADTTGAVSAVAAITAAFALAVTLGLPARFVAGTYLVDTPVTLPSGLLVEGCPETVIKSTCVPVDGFSGSPFIALEVSVGAGGTLAATPTIGSSTISVTIAVAPVIGNGISIVNHLNGNDALTYTVKNVAGVGPYTVTLDRPLVFPFVINDVVNNLSSYPQDIHIEGEGMTFTGTGDRYLELAASARCLVRNVRFDATTAAGGTTWGAFSYDVGGYENRAENLWANMTGAPASAFGCILESQEHTELAYSTVIGAPNYCIALMDSAYTTIRGCHVTGAGAGACGYQFTVDGASSYGSFDCEMIGCTASDIGTGALISNVTAKSNPRLTSCVFARCVTGLHTNGTGWVYAANVSCPGSTAAGVLVDAGAPLHARNLALDGCFVGVNANDTVDIDGLSVLLHINNGVLLAAGGSIAHFTTTSNGAFPAFDVTGRVALAHGKSTVTGAQAVVVEGATTLVLTDATLTGAAARAVYVAATGTLRYNGACDFSGSAAGVVLAGATSYVNRKQTSAGSVGGVAVAWPDIKSTDEVILIPTAAVFTGWVSTINPGTGFTIKDAAAGTYEYFIP